MAPVQTCIGRANAAILKKSNLTKDARVKTCTEIIEGIKYIKIYGWEMAFKHIIQQLRKEEIQHYIKLGFFRSLERALGNSTHLIASLTCFYVMYATGEGTGLSVAKIFSTLELMATARVTVFYFGLAMSFFFELHVIFERFCNIYNIKEKRMIEIDPISKEPLEEIKKR